jgi:hypothetical protein
MKTNILLLAALFIGLTVHAQSFVQQQTTTFTNNSGYQVMYSNPNIYPIQNTTNNFTVWDPNTNSSYLIPATAIQMNQFNAVYGNSFHQDHDDFYTGMNPIQSSPNHCQPQQTSYYVDQFGNPILPQNNYVAPTNYPVQTCTSNNYYQPTSCSPITSSFPMNQSDFAFALSTIRHQNFESTRLTVAKQILSSHWVTSDQVRQIMKQMNFEDSRLEIARYAYNRVVDKNNFYMVNNGFVFSSSIDQLNTYLFGN